MPQIVTITSCRKIKLIPLLGNISIYTADANVDVIPPIKYGLALLLQFTGGTKKFVPKVSVNFIGILDFGLCKSGPVISNGYWVRIPLK